MVAYIRLSLRPVNGRADTLNALAAVVAHGTVRDALLEAGLEVTRLRVLANLDISDGLPDAGGTETTFVDYLGHD